MTGPLIGVSFAFISLCNWIAALYMQMFKIISAVKDFLGWHATKKLFEARYRIFSASYFAQGLVFGITGIAFPIYLQKQFNLTMGELGLPCDAGEKSGEFHLLFLDLFEKSHVLAVRQ